MDISQITAFIYESIIQLVPLFRVVWVATVMFGFAMLIIAFALKKNPVRKISPWVIGGIALLMVVSSGTQLIMSFV